MNDYSFQKLNCWEFHNCGREKDGLMVEKLGECPVSTAMNHDGVNDGIAGGRTCWTVVKSHNRLAKAGMCTGNSCQSCEFYRRVQHENETASRRQINSPVVG